MHAKLCVYLLVLLLAPIHTVAAQILRLERFQQLVMLRLDNTADRMRILTRQEIHNRL